MAAALEAQRLVELRGRWLNPPEWVEWVDEPVPGYPKRPVPRDGDAAKALKKRTLTNLYNARPQWLADAHAALDVAVAAAYGWPADISDDEVRRELLALKPPVGVTDRRSRHRRVAPVAATDLRRSAGVQSARMRLRHITYGELTAKQREIYNFQKVASLLADYGFNCIKLDDDWQGADFLAYHKDGSSTLKVQLKARATVCKKYQDKDLYLAFPATGRWYLLPHDELVKIAEETTQWLQSRSWIDDGLYSSRSPSKLMLDRLSGHALEPNDTGGSW